MNRYIRKSIVGLGLTLGIMAAGISVNNAIGKTVSVEAATKNTVKTTLKSGTLTVSGKGVLKKSFKNNKKIKKIVVKEGVTELGKSCFEGCKNLKTVYLPKSMREISYNAFKNCKKINTVEVKSIPYWEYQSGCRIKNVKINKKVNKSNFSLYTGDIKKLPGENWILSKNNKKYTSIDGVIYTKNKKELVKVPNGRKSLKIYKKCETVNTSAFFYNGYMDDEIGNTFNGSIYMNLKSIEIPSSVKKIKCNGSYDCGFCNLNKVVVKTTKLSNENVEEFMKTLNNIRKIDGNGYGVTDNERWSYLSPEVFTRDKLIKIFSKYMTHKDGMWFIDGKALYYADVINTDQDLIIPEGCTKVCYGAVVDRIKKCKSLVLPASLKVIESDGFLKANVEEIIDANKCNDLEIGSEAFAFSGCKKFECKGNIKSLGWSAFRESKNLESVQLNSKTIKKIDSRTFAGCEQLIEIVLPDSVQTVCESAFSRCYKLDIRKVVGNRTIDGDYE